jgi:hypothetical protein
VATFTRLLSIGNRIFYDVGSPFVRCLSFPF